MDLLHGFLHAAGLAAAHCPLVTDEVSEGISVHHHRRQLSQKSRGLAMLTEGTDSTNLKRWPFSSMERSAGYTHPK